MLLSILHSSCRVACHRCRNVNSGRNCEAAAVCHGVVYDLFRIVDREVTLNRIAASVLSLCELKRLRHSRIQSVAAGIHDHLRFRNHDLRLCVKIRIAVYICHAHDCLSSWFYSISSCYRRHCRILAVRRHCDVFHRISIFVCHCPVSARDLCVGDVCLNCEVHSRTLLDGRACRIQRHAADLCFCLMDKLFEVYPQLNALIVSSDRRRISILSCDLICCQSLAVDAHVIEVCRGGPSCRRARSDRKVIIGMSYAFRCSCRCLLQKHAVRVNRDRVCLCIIGTDDLVLIVQPVRRKFCRHSSLDRSPASARIDVEVYTSRHRAQCKCIVALSCKHIILRFSCRSHVDFDRKGAVSLKYRVEHIVKRNREISAHHDAVSCIREGSCRLIRNLQSILTLIRNKCIIALKSLDLFNVRCDDCFSVFIRIDKLSLSICQRLIRCLKLFCLIQLAVIIYNELIHSLDHFICSFLVISVLIKGIYSMVCHRRIDHSICICVICDRHHRIFPLINFIVRELILRQRSLSAGRTTGSE